jgi:GR25 family glycosyltransferase involved in LPS biosynthesis
MRRSEASGWIRNFFFRLSRAVLGLVGGGGRISAFGLDEGMIGRILILNLDRQPQRMRRTLRELSRFRTADGTSLARLARRLSATDARDGSAVAATSDVDQFYRISDQLYVQPDPQLEACFDADQPVRMTRQEVAVAQTHVEAWKVIAKGSCEHVLVLEDDVWFSLGASAAIDRGWSAAVRRQADHRGPRLLYFSYEDAGGTALRTDKCEALFRPERGLWFLSGYVLSREGADRLLRSMPIIGPVDMWMNYRFQELGALALNSPAILQRPDGGSDNSYSIMPFLARAGIVDGTSVPEPSRAAGPVLAWAAEGSHERLAMSLSILGLRVRVCDREDQAISASEFSALLNTFDALVDAILAPCAVAAVIANVAVKFIFEADACPENTIRTKFPPPSRTLFLPPGELDDTIWGPICALLDINRPTHAFPKGAPREWKLFRDGRPSFSAEQSDSHWLDDIDDSPWALPLSDFNPSQPSLNQRHQMKGQCLVHEKLTTPSSMFPRLVETFPGNLAAFTKDGIQYSEDGARLVLEKVAIGDRPYRSGAFGSVSAFGHGRFEAEIRAARGAGLVTGFFLHRAAPRQEIDIELTGDDPHSMLVNVYFNPGDDGTALAFGYRGSPCRVSLGFDATAEFHHYAIDWRPRGITWWVDGKMVHERASWEPTPIPHLPMHLHANLWAPRSKALSGTLDEASLPLTSGFRNVSVWS